MFFWREGRSVKSIGKLLDDYKKTLVAEMNPIIENAPHLLNGVQLEPVVLL